ncbi:MAG: hypothetical protein PHZ24_04770 [Bacteroidales bacterium]|nr:hypothetical protein [Bacteroidales bacterium]
MKKLLLGFAVIGMISLASCSKERDCKCTTSITGDSIATSSSTSTVHIEDGRCRDMNSETTILGITSKVVCK